MKEFQLITKFFKPLTRNQKAARGLADDVAQIADLAISKDVFVEDVHFLKSDGGFKIASKLLRSNLSDLAASGATPLYYMLGFSKNKNTDEKFLSDFSRGLESVQNEFGLYLIGGDTVQSDKLFFSITIFGKVKNNKILARNAAKVGDLIYVSGNIGDAFLGRTTKACHPVLVTKSLEHYCRKPRNRRKVTTCGKCEMIARLLTRHFFPEPRIKLGEKLLEKNLSKCAIDVSDGLLADLTHICKASKIKAKIQLEKIPFSPEAKKIAGKNLLDLITGGDDYELIFAVDPKNQKKISALAKEMGLDLTQIGQFTSSTKFVVELYDQNKKIKLTKLGYEH